ncbi:MAG: type II secretion system major pseudopilin GspG [Rhodospirillales bacterium]|nr:type II secretion system major pseudopilin GspG [Rhodospirillales bacterium]
MKSVKSINEENISRCRKQRGFTLIELLVVLIILGLVAMFAVPQAMKFLGGAKSDAAQIQIQNLGTILDLYRLETGRYPNQDEGLEALVQKPAGAEVWNGPYIKKRAMIIDPWGRPYVYVFPGNKSDYDLYSLGADGAEGGEGENKDVVSW